MRCLCERRSVLGEPRRGARDRQARPPVFARWLRPPPCRRGLPRVPAVLAAVGRGSAPPSAVVTVAEAPVARPALAAAPAQGAGSAGCWVSRLCRLACLWFPCRVSGRRFHPLCDCVRALTCCSENLQGMGEGASWMRGAPGTARPSGARPVRPVRPRRPADPRRVRWSLVSPQPRCPDEHTAGQARRSGVSGRLLAGRTGSFCQCQRRGVREVCPHRASFAMPELYACPCLLIPGSREAIRP